MTPKCLIIGYGRAGKRHAKIAENFGLDVFTCDPYVMDTPYVHHAHLDYALKSIKPDYVVIATPPNMHLEQIMLCRGISTLCEKPLCGFGQLQPAMKLVDYDSVMVAQNYRFHPALQPVISNQYRWWWINSQNYRNGGIPKWGLLLDHVSHAVDTLRFVAGDVTNLEDARHNRDNEHEVWSLCGDTTNGKFVIDECLWSKPHPRNAYIEWSNESDGGGLTGVEIDANPLMYTNMWTAFLSGDYQPNIKDAIETQRVLQQAWDMSR